MMSENALCGSDVCDVCRRREAIPWLMELMDESYEIRNLCQKCISSFVHRVLKLRPASEIELSVWRVMAR